MTTDNPAVIEEIARLANESEPLVLQELADGRQLFMMHHGYGADYARDFDHPLHHVRAQVRHHLLESFVDYLRENEGDGTTVYVELLDCAIRAVVDDNVPAVQPDAEAGVVGAPARVGWRHHLAVFEPVETEEWKVLFPKLNVWMNRQQFRELVVKLQRHITEPDLLDVIGLAERFNVSSKVEFVEGQSIGTGARSIQLMEQHTAKGGGAAEIEVPETITFDLAQFIDSSVHSMPCQFRWDTTSGELMIRLEFLTLEALQRETFTEYSASLAMMLPSVRRVTGKAG